jgi:Flp pilus assembly protein TadD
VNPRDAEVLSNLAGYHAALGDNKEALSLLREVIRLKPTGVRVLLRVAETFEQAGQRESALEWIERAVDAGQSLAEINTNPSLKSLRADARFRTIVERDAKNKTGR